MAFDVGDRPRTMPSLAWACNLDRNMVEVAQGEERKLSSWVGTCTMGEHEGGSELGAILAGDHVHHPG